MNIKKMISTFTCLLIVVFTLTAQKGSSCSNPIVIDGTGETKLISPNTYECAFSGGENVKQWFSFKATQSGKISLTSCGLTDEDTHVLVYPGAFCEPLLLTAESDDFCGFQSRVSFKGTQGNDYLIVWINKKSSNGFKWTLTEGDWAEGESCTVPKQANATSVNVCDHSAGTDQWFTYTAPGAGTITLSSCGNTTENTLVKVYSNCAGELITINDEHCNQQSEVIFDCSEATEYLILWDKVDANTSYNWSLSYAGIPTSFTKHKNARALVSPNPAKDQLFVDVSGLQQVRIELFSMTGQSLRSAYSDSGGIETIDVSMLNAGIYLVSIEADDFSKVIKIAKE
ncbi:MAG: T9SS type A sorting domain-containing protein [Marinilabiliaceae bacterium]|nr:T9SS type A sorting domain-containing protein [Marinilabiliaceae bacterium]